MVTLGLRAAVRSAATEASAVQRRLAAAEDARCLESLAADGVEVISAEEIDFAAFKTAVAGVVARETASLDSGLLDMWHS